MELLSVPFAMKDLQEVDGSPRGEFRAAMGCHSTRGYHARGGRGRRPLRSSRLAAVNVVVAAARRAALPSTACVPPARSYWLRQNPKNGVSGALASISTRNSSVNGNGVLGGEITAQANWMISFLSPNQGIPVGDRKSTRLNSSH